MESHSRIFKVIVQFQEKDEVFYSRIKSVNGVPGSLVGIICARYPSLSNLIKRCFVIDKSGSEFSIITGDDLAVFLDAEDLFENVVNVEINGVDRSPAAAPLENDTPLKRVRIEETQASPSSPSATASPQTNNNNTPYLEGLEVHANVICDCCDREIVGFRYKCTECFNFDLCMQCEGKMRHRDHIMMRIPSPTLSLMPFPKHAGRRHWKKHLEAAAAAAAPEPEKSHRHHHGKRHQRRCQRPGNFMDGFFRHLTEDSSVSDAELGQEGAATNTPQQQRQDQGQGQQTTTQPMPPMYDFQKLVKVVEAVAGNVSKLFDPLGMSLDTYADYGVNVPPTTTTTTTNAPAAPAAAAADPPQFTCGTTPQTPQAAEKEKEATAAATATQKLIESEQMNVEQETPAAAAAPPSTLSSSSVGVPEPFIIDVADESNTSNQSHIIHPTTDAVPMSPSSAASNHSDDAEWLVISNEGMPETVSLDQDKGTQMSPRKESVASTSVQTTVAASTETSAQTQGYDELARKLQKDIEEQLRLNSSTAGTQTTSSAASTSAAPSAPVPFVYHPVPHINLSIIKMMDMGFSNDGGCLTELMACCNGDIRRALDSLLYKK